MAWKQNIAPNLGVKVQPGWCLGYVSQVLGINSSAFWRAWQAWAAAEHRHGPDVPPPTDAISLLWFDHWGNYGEGWGQYGHVVLLIPGVGIYSSPTGALGSPASFARWGTIAEVEANYNCTYVGWSEDLAWVRIIEPVADPVPVEPPKPTQGEDEMSKPLLAMKLDGGSMNGLGVMYEPDGQVTGLTPGEWDFWRDRVGCVPVECRNPGHWEYLSMVMSQRRKRAGVTLTAADIKKISDTVKDSVSGVTAEQVAASLQVTVKP